MTSAPAAVLLDAGGVFLLPEHRRLQAAFAGAEWEPPAEAFDQAHYLAAASFTVDADAEGDWAGCWRSFLEVYVEACGVPPGHRAEVHDHLDNLFSDAALWNQEIPGAREGLRALASTGVTLGVVSNADGLIAQRLRTHEILQVGPGLGVEVGCVVDSGAVGVMKPDPRIFRIALDALGVDAADTWYVGDMPGIDVVGARRAGIRPFLIDPLDLHHDADFARTASLAELAAAIAA